MLWTFLLQLIIALSAIGLLRMQRVRDRLVAAAALAGRITVHSANVIFYYLIACLVGLAIISAGFFLGLLIRAISPGVGNFIITACCTVTVMALGIVTLFLAAITGAVSNTIFRVRQTLAKANPATDQKLDWDGMFAKLVEQFPEQKNLLDAVHGAGKGWLASLFDTSGVKAILALPHNIAFDTIESVTGAVDKLFKFAIAALLWVAISGFVAMWLPDSANAFYIIAIPYGLLTLLGIGAYKGDKWCRDHNLSDLWWGGYQVVRWGVRCAVFGLILTLMNATFNPSKNFSHWIVGMRIKFQTNEEQSAKDNFGANFDQNIQLVVAPGTGYKTVTHLFGSDTRIPVSIRINELLWKTDAEHKQYDGIGPFYGEYMRQMPGQDMTPNPDNIIWYPESKVAAAGNVESRTVTIPAGVNCYADSLGVPSNFVEHTEGPVEVVMTKISAYAHARKVFLGRFYDRNEEYKYWFEI